MRRLGVLGGTFDPVHDGHMALCREAIRHFALDGAVLLPLGRPAEWEAQASPQDRLAMCRLAAAGEEGVAVSQSGMGGGVRHITDALGPLRREYPDSRFFLILGADELQGLPHWHEKDKLFAQCDFLCFPRQGIAAQEAMEKTRAAGARVELLKMEAVPPSAGMIRERTAAYQDAPGLNRRVLCYMAERGLYQTDWLPRLKTMMNPRRFQHTLGVRREAVRLADIHGASIQRAALAGLLHDCAKGMSVREMDRIARDMHLIDDENMYGSGAMLHGPVGAYLAKTQFGVRDEEILNAIRGHTIGRVGMTKLELVIFVADATEEGREDYEGLRQIRFLADRSLPAAALKSMETTQQYLRRTGRPFFPAVYRTIAYLESVLTEDERTLLASAK